MDDIVIASTGYPISYKGRHFSMTSARISGGKAAATLDPANPELQSELIRRLERYGSIRARYAYGELILEPDDS